MLPNFIIFLSVPTIIMAQLMPAVPSAAMMLGSDLGNFGGLCLSQGMCLGELQCRHAGTEVVVKKCLCPVGTSYVRVVNEDGTIQYRCMKIETTTSQDPTTAAQTSTEEVVIASKASLLSSPSFAFIILLASAFLYWK